MHVHIADILKSSTDVGQMVYQYWWNRLPVLVKSYTGIDKIVYQGNEFAFSQYRYTISSIRVEDLATSDRGTFIDLWWQLKT